jgi:Protein of unknown function (DUF2971)
MLVYHFLNANHGLDDIRRRRMKVATLHELNDPFELYGVSLKDEGLRPVVRELKAKAAAQMGLLCFSRDWHNPVLWSHYGDRHTGLCLGFEVPDEHLFFVSYSRRRVAITAEDLRYRVRGTDNFMKFLFTKYTHWRYEAEARVFINLTEVQSDNGLHFADFGTIFRLRTVIVGAQSAVTRGELSAALGELTATVKVFKARLAFRTFRVVRQKRDEFWP